MTRKRKSCCAWSGPADTGATHQTYEIRTVSDFLKVPEERRRICLREFDSWLYMREAIPKLIQAASQGLGHALPDDAMVLLNPDVFAWIDDGKATIGVTLNEQPYDVATGPAHGKD